MNNNKKWGPKSKQDLCLSLFPPFFFSSFPRCFSPSSNGYNCSVKTSQGIYNWKDQGSSGPKFRTTHLPINTVVNQMYARSREIKSYFLKGNGLYYGQMRVASPNAFIWSHYTPTRPSFKTTCTTAPFQVRDASVLPFPQSLRPSLCYRCILLAQIHMDYMVWNLPPALNVQL